MKPPAKLRLSTGRLQSYLAWNFRPPFFMFWVRWMNPNEGPDD
jgi:hypothetical protein